MSSEPQTRQLLQSIAHSISSGNWNEALQQAKSSDQQDEPDVLKTRAYLLLANQKYPEADTLCSKILGKGLDHEALAWRGVARAELGLWFSALEDLVLAQEFFPLELTRLRIDFTSQRACKNISEGMRLDGGTYQDFFERSRIYLLDGDLIRAARDLAAAEKLKPEQPELKKLKARLLFEQGKLRESLTQVDAYLDETPDDLDCILLKAKIKSATGRLRAALKLLRDAARLMNRDQISQMKIAKCRHIIRDFHGAIQDFDSMLEIHGASPSLLIGRGQSFFEIRKFDEAIADFQRAVELGGSSAYLQTVLGEAKLAKGSDKEASAAFKQALSVEPNHWPARLGYAKVKSMRGKKTESIRMASELLQQHPNHHEIDLLLGSVAYDEKDYVTAQGHFSNALKKCQTHHDRANCFYQRGTAHLENQDASSAVSDFDRALELRPFHVGTLVWRGYAFAKMGQWSKAITDLQMAIDMNPLAAERYRKLGEYIAQQALEYFEKRIQSDKAADADYFNRGMAYLFLGKTELARNDFEQTLELNPKHGEAQVRLGTLYLAEGHSKKAYHFFSQAVKTKTSPTALLLRADAMLQLGVIQPAFLDIRDAIRSSRDNDRLYVRRGELYAVRDNLEKALDDFTLSIALNYDNFQAFRERGKLFIKKNMPKEAIRDLSLSLHFFPKQPALLLDRAQLFLQTKQYQPAMQGFEQALAFQESSPKQTYLQQALSDSQKLDCYIGWAKAALREKRGQDALSWLTKALHRFQTPEAWARLVKARAEIFLAMGRFERASADARIASKLHPDPEFGADCYYLRALCSHYHKDREHAVKTLEKALELHENHADAELALDWFREMADAPPAAWQSPPKKIRPKRPQVVEAGSPVEISERRWQGQPPMDLWLVKMDDQEFGPIPFKTIQDWAAEKRITGETKLFRTDWGEWKTAAKLAE